VNILIVFGNSQAPFPPVNESLCRDLVATIPLNGVRLYTPPNERFVPLLRSTRQTSAGSTSVAMGFTLITDLASVRRPFRAVFLGGGQREFALFQALHGLVPCFPVASTGGAALHMLDKASPAFPTLTDRDLRGSISFASLWSRILSDTYPPITRPVAPAAVGPAVPVASSIPATAVGLSSAPILGGGLEGYVQTTAQTLTYTNEGPTAQTITFTNEGLGTLLLNPRR
jgi:hypothetical protein